MFSGKEVQIALRAIFFVVPGDAFIFGPGFLDQIQSLTAAGTAICFFHNFHPLIFSYLFEFILSLFAGLMWDKQE